MTDAGIYTWILLSIPETGGTRRDISELADFINHAIPTHEEIETSLRWLQEQDFVREADRRIALTETGATFVRRLRTPIMMDTWTKVTEAIQDVLDKA